MWPRTARGEERQRVRKRRKEGRVLFELLRVELASRGMDSGCDILEFGAGAGYQAPWLGQLGRLVVSDIYVDSKLSLPSGIPFVMCDVARAPFASECFDLIFSNHVIEHLEDFEASFRELKRIGRVDCLYAFAVPTALWVLLSVPVQYRDKAENIWARIRGQRNGSQEVCDGGFGNSVDHVDYGSGSRISKFFPHGHGRYEGFLEALAAFRVGSWRTTLSSYGFELVCDRSVLCYGPAGWPVIPTNRLLARAGICSSRLFLLRKTISQDH